MGSFVGLSLALAGATFSLRVFGNEKVVFWRESSVGSNTFAYFLGKDLAHLPNNLLLPLLFLGGFYTLVTPRGDFGTYYGLLLLVWLNGTSMGYLLSVIMKPSMAQIAVVILIFMLMLFSGIQPTLPEMESYAPPLNLLPYLSFLRYANEIFYLNEIKRWSAFYNIQTGLTAYGYDFDMWSVDWFTLFVIGLFTRILSAVLMHVLDRNKRL